jgi:hypothetical protein
MVAKRGSLSTGKPLTHVRPPINLDHRHYRLSRRLLRTECVLIITDSERGWFWLDVKL